MVRATRVELDSPDILAHLFYAVGLTDHVLVTSVIGEFAAALEEPDGSSVVLQCTEVPPPLAAGAPVCVEYAGGGDAYRFYTEVLDVEGPRVRLILPYAVECTDRRLGRRIAVAPDAGFEFVPRREQGLAPFPLADISTGGACLIDREGVVEVGRLLAGELVLPDGQTLRCCMEVRHLGLRRGELYAGARLVGIALRDRARLARFLLEWTRRETTGRGESPIT